MTYTTRPERPNSDDRSRYHFVSTAEFHRMIENSHLFEHEQVWGNYYGIGVKELDQAARATSPVVLELDIRGAKKILELHRSAKLLFLYCASDRQKDRLLRRGFSLETLADRMNGSAEETQVARKLFAAYPERVVIIDNSEQSIEETVTRVEREIITPSSSTY